MSRSVTTVVVGLVLLLVAATVWVPVHIDDNGLNPGGVQSPWWLPGSFSWGTDGILAAPILPPGQRGALVTWGYPRWRMAWSFWIAELVLVLLAGGGMLTFVMRRERRRRAADSG